EGSCRDISLHDTRIIARINAVRVTDTTGLKIANSRLNLLDTAAGRATVSLVAEDALIERNTLAMIPFVDETPGEPDQPDDNPDRDPADPCARSWILYAYPYRVWTYAATVWGYNLALLFPQRPYRAI